MAEICQICGLPKELCICDQITTEQRKIYIVENRVKGSKFVTSISGIDNQKDIEELAKTLKKELACGGTTKKGTIELQGKQRKRVINLLMKKGYNVSQIS